MGGKTFKNHLVQRIDNIIYEELKLLIKEKLHDLHLLALRRSMEPDLLPLEIQLYFFYNLPNKESHGDLDILFISDIVNIKDMLIEKLNPVEIQVNGILTEYNILYSYNNLLYQIDFIKCPSLELLPNYIFYGSYSDIGMIIGTIIKSYGLSLGPNGLFIKLHKNTLNLYQNLPTNYDKTDNTNLKIILSTDLNKICEYIGVKYDDWLSINKSRSSIEDIYSFLDNIKFNDNSWLNLNSRKNRDRQDRLLFADYYLYRSAMKTIINKYNDKSECENQLQAIKDFNKENELDEYLKIQPIKNNKINWKDILLSIENNKRGEFKQQFIDKMETKYKITFNDFLEFDISIINEELNKLFI